jgi:capsular exopolysaccharide synthesis family protein
MRQPPIVSDSFSHYQPPTESKSFDPWILWVTLRRCWYWAIPIGLVLACLTGFSVLADFQPRYRASHLIEANEDFILYKGVMPTVRDLALTEKTIFFNEVVLGPVLSNPELREAPSLQNPATAERNLRKNLSVSSAGSAARMTVSYEDTDREYAAKVCNAVVDAYMLQRADLDQNRIAVLEDLLEPEIKLYRDRVSQQEQNVKDWTIRTQGFDPSSPLGIVRNESRIQQLAAFEDQANTLEIEILFLEGELKLESGDRSDATDRIANEEPAEETFIPPMIVVNRMSVGPAEIAQFVNRDAAVVEAASKIARFEGLVNQMEDSGVYRLNKTQYAEFKKSRDEWVAKLAEARADAEKRAATELAVIADADFAEKQRLKEQQIEALRKAHEEKRRVEKANRLIAASKAQSDKSRTLRETIADKKRELKVVEEQRRLEAQKFDKLVGNSAQLLFAQDDLRRAQDMLNKLEDRVAAIRTERQQINAVRSVSPATPPKDPVEDIPLKKLVAASGAAFIIPLLIGLLLEIRTNRVADSASLENRGIAPVIGELAKSPSTAAGRGSKGRRVFQESVDTMRANLFLSKDTKDSRSIAIVSSMSGEGKSTAASQLAISLAKSSGKTVLLIDADMRCPDQHDHFGVHLEPGLSAVLMKQVSLDDAIETDLGDLIHILPAGRLKASPHRLMSPEAMKELVEQSLERYTYVIFDTAPVLSAGETLAVAAAVDTTLVCALRDVTRMDSVIRTTHRLESAGANVAGTIFSGVTLRQYAYRYGDYNYSNFTQIPEATS